MKRIRDDIRESLGITVSAGIGPNVLLARMATKKAKPNGQYSVDPQFAEQFIGNRPVKELPGVGWSTARRLEKEMGVVTCQGLRGLTKDQLQVCNFILNTFEWLSREDDDGFIS